MANYPKILDNLINGLMKFPGIGRRSAERIAFYLVKADREEVSKLCEAMDKLKQGISLCKFCNNLSENEICNICADPQRDHSIVAIVEEPKDLLALEKTGIFKGLYHVLMGAIAPLEGRGPDELKIKDLITRIKEQEIKEVIIATDSDTEGETTALYLTKLLKPLGIKITRIGFGIPVGGSLEYADTSTLSHALEARREI
jgi:recombination protein RecR